ncbi:hypothetical protein [Mesorhizobium silamurunense]|uniref:hypothetical protein n=1 Tax=Mesorhizobium silamurunense TaxID=499528 RepID=UPI0017835543|nr:hypothetical protein [Mesorhizobium silamurunense]
MAQALPAALDATGAGPSVRSAATTACVAPSHGLSHAVAIGYSIVGTTANTTGQSFEALTILTTICLAINLSVSAAMNIYNRRVTLRHLSYADWQLCASCRL